MTSFRRLAPIALALCLGFAGGALFSVLSLPLPWMLGALAATLAAAVLGAPIRAPEVLRSPTIMVIGVLLGSGFKPELLGSIAGWWLSMTVMAVYLALAAAAGVPYYRRVAGFDRTTAYYAAMPGGITEMMLLGRAAGGDERWIILAHAARIIVTVSCIGLWFRVIEGRAVGGVTGGAPLLAMHPADVALLGACGLAGALLGRALRLPAPLLVGPMILSGAAHLAGLTASAPPPGLVVAAQVVLGTVMGTRFIGTPARDVSRALRLSLGATAVSLGLALVAAMVLERLNGTPSEVGLLAYAPGGLAEMSLVALAIGAEVALVATHHVARIVMVVAVAPLFGARARPPD